MQVNKTQQKQEWVCKAAIRPQNNFTYVQYAEISLYDNLLSYIRKFLHIEQMWMVLQMGFVTYLFFQWHVQVPYKVYIFKAATKESRHELFGHIVIASNQVVNDICCASSWRVPLNVVNQCTKLYQVSYKQGSMIWGHHHLQQVINIPQPNWEQSHLKQPLDHVGTRWSWRTPNDFLIGKVVATWSLPF